MNGDTISRSSILRKLDSFHPDYTFNIASFKNLIKAEPVVQKKGKWIIKENPGTGWYRVTCSECGEDVTSVIPTIGFYPNAKAIWDFCPWCGADMRGEQE